MHMYVNHFQNFKKEIARGMTRMTQKLEIVDFLFKE